MNGFTLTKGQATALERIEGLLRGTGAAVEAVPDDSETAVCFRLESRRIDGPSALATLGPRGGLALSLRIRFAERVTARGPAAWALLERSLREKGSSCW